MFLKYPSLVNHYVIGKESRITERLDKLWYSTEKIHGANASYILDRNGCEYYAKRSGIIDFSHLDKQFNQLRDVVSESIKIAAKEVLKAFKSDKVIIYGEYFGKGVQVMDYDIIREGKKDFRVFNIFVHFKDDEYLVLGLKELKWFLKDEDLVPIKDVHTLRDFLKDSADEKSLLGGYSEGEVYKPVESYTINNHMGFIGVKHKTEKYLETEKVSKKTPKSKSSLSITELEIQEDLGKYITVNRLNNVLSHGEFELIPQNIGKLMISMKEDIIDEYIKENDVDESINFLSLINGYSRDIAKMIKDKMGQESMELVSNK